MVAILTGDVILQEWIEEGCSLYFFLTSPEIILKFSHRLLPVIREIMSLL